MDNKIKIPHCWGFMSAERLELSTNGGHAKSAWLKRTMTANRFFHPGACPFLSYPLDGSCRKSLGCCF
jgi:hypothetical protein